MSIWLFRAGKMANMRKCLLSQPRSIQKAALPKSAAPCSIAWNVIVFTDL